jgi:hypothetical protein
MRSAFRKYDEPRVVQFSVFLKNRVGELLEMIVKLSEARIQIHGLSIWDATDHAVIRIILSDPPWAAKTLKEAGYTASTNDLVAVELDDRPDAVGAVCRALLEAEINIHYSYPLLSRPRHQPVLLLHVDDLPEATTILARKRFDLLHQGHLDTSSEEQNN